MRKIKTRSIRTIMLSAFCAVLLACSIGLFSGLSSRAQTAADLLNRMAIPQLRISPDDQITDPAGKSVDVFIDFLPASSDDMQGMRIQDVKRVEYYDFPTDPRFQGKAHGCELRDAEIRVRRICEGIRLGEYKQCRTAKHIQ